MDLTYVGEYEETSTGEQHELLVQEEALLEEKVIKEEEKPPKFSCLTDAPLRKRQCFPNISN